MAANWIDRAIGFVSPKHGLARGVARKRMELFRAYKGSDRTRREMGGWQIPGEHINDSLRDEAPDLLANARDAVRNNPYAERIRSVIAMNAVGPGIIPDPKSEQLKALWDEWAPYAAAEGSLGIYGLQGLWAKTIPVDGAVLIRRRTRRESDGLPVPLQIQTLDPGHLDSRKHGKTETGRVVNGLDYDKLDRLRGFWIFDEHPDLVAYQESKFVSAKDMAYAFRVDTPGQRIGASWYAPIMSRLRMLDQYQKAELEGKLLESMAVGAVTGDAAGWNLMGRLSEGSNPTDSQRQEDWNPATFQYLKDGTRVDFYQPTLSANYPGFNKTNLQALGSGTNITYAALTGDYSDSSFSSNRMGHLFMSAGNRTYQGDVMVRQLGYTVWRWFNEAAVLAGKTGTFEAVVDHIAPKIEAHDRIKELQGDQMELRLMITTHKELTTRYGRNYDTVIARRQKEREDMLERGLVSDGEPATTTKAGQAQATDPNAFDDKDEETDKETDANDDDGLAVA